MDDVNRPTKVKWGNGNLALRSDKILYLMTYFIVYLSLFNSATTPYFIIAFHAFLSQKSIKYSLQCLTRLTRVLSKTSRTRVEAPIRKIETEDYQAHYSSPP